MNRQQSPDRKSVLHRARILAIIGVSTIFVGGVALAGGECVTVDVTDRFTLPDGTVHEASRLTLCTRVELSPVTGVHQISLDGNPVGLVVSRVGVSEGPARATPIVLFRRLSSGVLDLVGFAVPDGRRGKTFLLRGAPVPPETAVAVRTVPAVETDSPQSGGPAVLAASIAAD